MADELKAAGAPVLVSLDFPDPERWEPEADEADPEGSEAETDLEASEDEA
ncbi:MAG: hypothetical protein GWM93_04130, partial [Gemmatimonadetes bacterium]|nr:hypothetical protein [Gemmatimonadota bacterium]NIT65872.1 hypothetical protein [Gemmatimonadota bacterium]NIW74331.1 hypothetical protein [Gemmatimonadota bacterium]NIY34450.1 hypothetical protein [Gemmatimonadota bacterium]NIY42717.1 hypothetical protein [Gemmatimonadota bacterium]